MGIGGVVASKLPLFNSEKGLHVVYPNYLASPSKPDSHITSIEAHYNDIPLLSSFTKFR
jgi:hypothetical protein